MKRPARACALLLLAGALGACTNLGMFEDVGADPHPPQLQLLGVEYQPTETTTPEPRALRPAGRSAAVRLSSPDGFVVRPFDEATSAVMFRVQYFDAGGDIETITLRDLDGSLNAALEAVPVETDTEGEGGTPAPAPTLVFFAGTSGTVDLGYVAFPPGVEGPHRLELWAEDSHGSRSEKITFTFELVI